MRRGRLLAGTLALAALLLTSSAPITRGDARVGGMVDSLLWIQETNQSTALQKLHDGGIDIYMFPLRSAADIAEAKSNPNLWTINGTGGSFNLLLNPVPVNQSLAPGVANPLSKRGVREAMNYLIDRDFIAAEIAGASQFPQVTLENQRTPEYARDAAFMYALEQNYRFNETRASEMTANALQTDPDYRYNAATNRWQFQGNDINLNFVIRAEDLRRDIGNYVADRLERIGFGVNRLYTSGTRPAVIYDPPPDTGAWQLYTEGWAQTALTAWADRDPDFYSCGGDGHTLWSMYRAPAALEDACTKLRDGRYASLEERKQVFERATEESLQDSVRVWLTAGTSTFALSKRVTSLVYDLAGGPWGRLATRTARFETPGGRLVLGQRLHYLTPWNPWGGFGWLYDALEQYALTDPAVWPHPHTGLYIPVRASFSVNAPGPEASMAVPADARIWDPATFGFAPVAAGTTAKASVTYQFTLGTWHDGSNFTMDDVLYELALAFRRADARGDVHQKDPDAADAATRLLTERLRGFKVLDGTRIQVWYDYWHIDPSTIASLINPAFPSTPWSASELALTTVFDDTCRISEVTAANDGKDALDLTKGACMANMRALLPTMSSHLPPGLAFDPTEAASRWGSLRDFNASYGHFYVSNGPFILTKVDSAALQTTMVRDTNYPIDAHAYDAYLVPRVPEISFAEPSPVTIGAPATFLFQSKLAGGTPYDRIKTSWFVVGRTDDAILFQGNPTRVATGIYQITLSPTQTNTLQPGLYDMRTVTVGEEAAVPVIAIQSFVALQSVCAFTSCPPPPCISCEFEPVEGAIRDLRNQTLALTAQLRELQLLVAVSLAIAVAAISLMALMVVVTIRRRGSSKTQPQGGRP